VIGRYGIGVDNIDVSEATARLVPVTNVPAYCLDEVAEHTLALLLCLARKICTYNDAVRQDNWELAAGQPIYRVRGRTLGIVGFGKIGRRLADDAQMLGMQIVAYDPSVPAGEIQTAGVQPASLRELARRADFVSVHVPLTELTRGLINAEILSEMKPSAFVLNTARGGIVDQEALASALWAGRIAGAGIDVFDPERLPANHPLLGAPNLIATPHVAFYSEESVVELERLAAENVAAVLAGRRPAHVVNPEVFESPRWSNLRRAETSG
jgi:D-3-phosphoglycerate dehydrogenase